MSICFLTANLIKIYVYSGIMVLNFYSSALRAAVFKGFGVLAVLVMLYIKQAGMALCLPAVFYCDYCCSIITELQLFAYLFQL